MAHRRIFISIPAIALILFCGVNNFLYAEGQGEIEKQVLTYQQINLTCPLNSPKTIIWHYKVVNNFDIIFMCKGMDTAPCVESTKELLAISAINGELSLAATRNNNTSVLSITPPTNNSHELMCSVGNISSKIFKVNAIEKSKLVPNCTVDIPGLNRYGIGSLILLCEVYSGDLNVKLNLEGISNHSRMSSLNITSMVLYFEHFKNVDNASCNAHFPDVNLRRSCRFPRIIQTENINAGNDIIVNRYPDHNKSDVGSWKLYDLDGKEEDIEERSWIRDGGHSLLIRNISEQDVGKNVIYRTNDTIWFIEIPKISGDESDAHSNTGNRTPTSGNTHNIYLVLTLLFLSLWVVTTVVGGVFYWVITKKTKSDTPVIATSSPSGYVSGASNGRSNEIQTPLSNVSTRGRRDPETTNTNNSAHNPAFEPETISTDENRRNRQGNDGNHLYFTLEKSPSPKISTSRQERPGSSLNHPMGSHWQGYETVGDPNKGVFCSFDLGEYADVSFQGKVTSDLSEYSEVDATQFRGTAPPGAGEYSEVRRSFRGKEQPTLPDRTSLNMLNKIPKGEQVERDEISRLYGKVKK